MFCQLKAIMIKIYDSLLWNEQQRISEKILWSKRRKKSELDFNPELVLIGLQTTELR